MNFSLQYSLNMVTTVSRVILAFVRSVAVDSMKMLRLFTVIFE